jgi:nucleoid-associated protein YgaU
MPPTVNRGTLEKLTILGFSDEKLTQNTGEYVVQINPEKYSQQYSTQMNSKPTLNTGGVTNKFVVQKPQDLSLEFYIDATGVVDASIGPRKTTIVQDEIEKFKKVVYAYNGSIHSPNYLRVLWGKLSFDCRLESIDIEYLLFTPSGVPLRAKVNTKFTQYLSPEKLQLKARKSSPDLTHSRTVVAGDTLPLLCFQIYQDSKYYVEIARVNGLNDFRNLQPGQQIFFPPLGD